MENDGCKICGANYFMQERVTGICYRCRKKLLPDPVNSPDHYTSGGIETIDYMAAKLTSGEFRGYLKGNIIKYVSRSGKKDDDLTDLKKAQWYLNKLIDVLTK